MCPSPIHGKEGRLGVAGHLALGGRATGIRAFLYSPPSPVPVQSATFVGRRSWVGLKNLGTSGVGGGITMASDSHFGASQAP